MSKQNKREYYVNTAMLILCSLMVVLFAIYLFCYIDLRLDNDLCSVAEMQASPALLLAWTIYDASICILELLITLWLIVASYFTIRILRLNINDNFKREK